MKQIFEIAMYTCDRCGRKVNEVANPRELPEKWTEARNKHICQTCVKVLDGRFETGE